MQMNACLQGNRNVMADINRIFKYLEDPSKEKVFKFLQNTGYLPGYDAQSIITIDKYRN